MTKGIVIFAQNNDYVDYVKIACACAGYARRNLSGFDEICLITDVESSNSNTQLVNKSFDRTIVFGERGFYTQRLYRDTVDDTQYAGFINTNRSNVYELSPYTETLVIDCDYFIMSNTLDGVWGSANDFMINKRYRDVSGGEDKDGNIVRVNDFSIDMYWATVFYFRKSEFTENLFNLILHIKNNYSYYYNLFNISGGLFRNDYAFSLALHILNGNVSHRVPELPIKYLMNSYDASDIYSVNSPTELTLLTSTLRKSKDNLFSRFKNTDLHIMNKRAVERHIDKFLEYGEFIHD